MAATTYDSALQLAQSLSEPDQLRLIQELATQSSLQSPKGSILEICGLGSEAWASIDALEHVRNERSSWDS